MKSLGSFAREGSGTIIIEFRDGDDTNRAIQDVRDRLSQVRNSLPRDAREPVVSRADTDNDQPIVMLSLSAVIVVDTLRSLYTELRAPARQPSGEEQLELAGGRVVD